MANITFKKLVEQEYAKFRTDVKEIFSIAVIETFGNPDNQEDIVPDNDIDLSLYNPQCEALAVYADGKKSEVSLSRLTLKRESIGWNYFMFILINMDRDLDFKYGKVWKRDTLIPKPGV